MAQPMPDNSFLQGPFAPIQMECNAPSLIIEGEMPKDLAGTFFRNGPNPQFAPIGEHHWFGGDGMLHAFHIADGEVSYLNRWVRTNKWNIENKLGRSVINPMNPFETEPEYASGDNGTLANTHVFYHADKLLALEEGHGPFELNPDTLESIGTFDYDGKLKGPMTAHPKIDPKTGEMVFFGCGASGPFSLDININNVNKDGQLTSSRTIAMPYYSMVHDFVVTENYVVVPILPIVGDLERAMTGKPPFAWEPDKGAFVAVVPRFDASAPVRMLEIDPCFVFHVMNGFDDGKGHISCDMCQFERGPLFPDPDGTPGDPDQSRSFLHRWTIDLNDANARVKSTRIDEYQSEFPRIDERFATLGYRYGFYGSPDQADSSADAGFTSVARYDHQTQSSERYSFGNGITSEPIFVPKSDTADEADGYLMSVVFQPETQTSNLNVFDAQTLADGPIAVAKLNHRVPLGFHGNWRPGQK